MPELATSSPHPTGEPLEAITNELIALHKAACGKGPSNARVHLGGDALVCLMRDPLTRAEQVLVASGDVELVAAQRRALHRTMRDAAVQLVERALGRRVVSFLPASDPRAAVDSLVFVLG